jgi:hypothetical protein
MRDLPAISSGPQTCTRCGVLTFRSRSKVVRASAPNTITNVAGERERIPRHIEVRAVRSRCLDDLLTLVVLATGPAMDHLSDHIVLPRRHICATEQLLGVGAQPYIGRPSLRLPRLLHEIRSAKSRDRRAQSVGKEEIALPAELPPPPGIRRRLTPDWNQRTRVVRIRDRHSTALDAGTPDAPAAPRQPPSMDAHCLFSRRRRAGS